MRLAAARFPGRGRNDLASRFVVLVTVLAFALQSFITQVHVHGTPQHAAGIVKADAGLSPAHNKTQHDNNLRDCPFCQAVAHAGAFVTPAAIPALVPVFAQYVVTVAPMRAVIAALAHGWLSRGPPQH